VVAPLLISAVVRNLGWFPILSDNGLVNWLVLPLDNSTLARFYTPRPSLTEGRTVFTYTRGLTGVPNSGAPNILNKSYTITAEVEIPAGARRDGTEQAESR
jgi:hypothetical protein